MVRAIKFDAESIDRGIVQKLQVLGGHGHG